MVNYTKNRWNNYDDSKTFSENLENDAILTLEKANHIEQGIYDANRAIEIGTIRIAENTEVPNISVSYNEDSIVMDFVLPRTNLSSADMTKILSANKEEFVKLFSRVYVGEDTSVTPNDNDVMFLLSKDGKTIEKIRTFTNNSDGTVSQTDLGFKVDISNLVTDENHQFMTKEEKEKLSGIAYNANNYTHPDGDGFKHVPETGTNSKGKFLTAGENPGDVSWKFLEKEDITTALGYTPANASEIVVDLASSQKDGLLSKEMFTKINGIEEGANNYVHPNTHSADMILETDEKQFISKEDKELLRFTNNEPTLVSHGGIPAGTTFDNVALREILGEILYPYTPPTVSCSVTVPGNGGTYEVGNTVDITTVRVGVTKKSKDIIKIEILSTDDVLNPIFTQESGVKDGGTFNFNINKQLSTLVSNFKIKARVTDASNKTVTADSGSFNLVYPIFYGAINKDVLLEDSVIRGMNKLVQGKANRDLSFTSDNQRLAYAYPATYGSVSSFTDPNGFNITDTFTKYTVKLRFGDDNIDYYVYVNEASTVNNFKIGIKY